MNTISAMGLFQHSRFQTVRSAAFTVALLVSMGPTLWGCGDQEVDVTIPQSDLQQKVAPKFPLHKKMLVVEVTLHSPNVYLRGDKVGMKLNVDAMFLKYPLKGTVDIQGGLSYVPETGQFFVTDVTIIGIEVTNTKQVDADKLKSVITPLLAETLKDTPVYTLTDKTLKEQLAGRFLKRVTIQNSALIATFGKKQDQ